MKQLITLAFGESGISFGPDEIFSRSDSAGVFSPLLDGVGSSISLTNESGATQSDYAYGAFGQVAPSGAASNNSNQYTGCDNDGRIPSNQGVGTQDADDEASE